MPSTSQTKGGATAEAPTGERRLTIAEALREAIAEEMRRDEKVFLIGEDVGVDGGFGGAFGVYLGLTEQFGHERIIDTPISEKAIAGAATGAALMGMRPIADMQYSDFLFECMDELVNQAAKMRYMSGGKLSVPMVMRAPVGTTNRGAQHGQCPESYFMHVPGLKVVCVSDAYSAKGILKSAVRDDNPVLIFEHKLLYGSKGRQQAGGMDLTAVVPAGRVSAAAGQGHRQARGRPRHRRRHAPQPLSQPRRRGGAGRRGHRVRGDRSRLALPAGYRDALGLGAQDGPARDRPRGHAERRLGRRDRRAGRRRVPLLAGGADQARGDLRRAAALRADHGAGHRADDRAHQVG